MHAVDGLKISGPRKSRGEQRGSITPWLWCGVLACLCFAPVSMHGASAAEPFGAKRGAHSEVRRPVEAELPFYSFQADHDPNGIGKFYMGREIAHVMGFAAAPWLERPEREREEQLSKMVGSLKLKPGMVVADIGAGSGVISVKLARAVSPGGKVLAVDIQEEMLNLLSKKVEQLGIENIEPVLGTIRSPRLPEGSVDLALMVDVYHEFSHPHEMLGSIARALKPGGRVVFVEFRKEDPEVPIKLVHKMTEAQVKREASRPEHGLRWKETIGVLPWQHVVVFERVAGGQ